MVHLSTASVPITVLLYDGLLLCCFNLAIKGLSPATIGLYTVMVSAGLSVCLSVCMSDCLFVYLLPLALPRTGSLHSQHASMLTACMYLDP